MNIFVTLYSAILFFILTPAVFLRLPPNGSKYTVAAVHAIAFAVIYHFTHKIVWRMSMGMEGLATGAATMSADPHNCGTKKWDAAKNACM
jgi:hypothetical protein